MSPLAKAFIARAADVARKYGAECNMLQNDNIDREANVIRRDAAYAIEARIMSLLQPASVAPPEKPRLSAQQRQVLEALDELTRPDGEWCTTFALLSPDPSKTASTRRIVRQLARKGLAEFHRGLMNDDGQIVGSGYCISRAGRTVVRGTEQ